MFKVTLKDLHERLLAEAVKVSGWKTFAIGFCPQTTQMSEWASASLDGDVENSESMETEPQMVILRDDVKGEHGPSNADLHQDFLDAKAAYEKSYEDLCKKHDFSRAFPREELQFSIQKGDRTVIYFQICGFSWGGPCGRNGYLAGDLFVEVVGDNATEAAWATLDCIAESCKEGGFFTQTTRKES